MAALAGPLSPAPDQHQIRPATIRGNVTTTPRHHGRSFGSGRYYLLHAALLLGRKPECAVKLGKRDRGRRLSRRPCGQRCRPYHYGERKNNELAAVQNDEAQLLPGRTAIRILKIRAVERKSAAVDYGITPIEPWIRPASPGYGHRKSACDLLEARTRKQMSIAFCICPKIGSEIKMAGGRTRRDGSTCDSRRCETAVNQGS